MKANELEERLINFAVDCIKICDTLSNTNAGNYYANQLVRSSGSSALNYGEARSGESKKDFQHKMSICLKELRESYNNLRIIKRAKLNQKKPNNIDLIIDEANQLVSIFVKSVKTSKNQKSNIVNR